MKDQGQGAVKGAHKDTSLQAAEADLKVISRNHKAESSRANEREDFNRTLC